MISCNQKPHLFNTCLPAACRWCGEIVVHAAGAIALNSEGFWIACANLHTCAVLPSSAYTNVVSQTMRAALIRRIVHQVATSTKVYTPTKIRAQRPIDQDTSTSTSLATHTLRSQARRIGTIAALPARGCSDLISSEHFACSGSSRTRGYSL